MWFMSMSDKVLPWQPHVCTYLLDGTTSTCCLIMKIGTYDPKVYNVHLRIIICTNFHNQNVHVAMQDIFLSLSDKTLPW